MSDQAMFEKLEKIINGYNENGETDLDQVLQSIDSLDFVALSIDIEAAFRIKFDFSKVHQKDLNSLDKLSSFIRERTSA
ncbi:hypothetical protein [Paenibacillus sinopodophylli]|uniref:hypothetical protein n=1 Tax=Paenibacillus sinopodophylli TaxID=1837342 RepID=UPI00110C8F32|nr:hypothetical protein [Paenibacillus sinopodophylli]